MNEIAQSSLFARATELVNETFTTLVLPSFFSIEIAIKSERGKPLPYLKVAAQLIREFNFKTIVEVGSMRHPLKHALDEFDPE